MWKNRIEIRTVSEKYKNRITIITNNRIKRRFIKWKQYIRKLRIKYKRNN
jgi:hypothetical protein